MEETKKQEETTQLGIGAVSGSTDWKKPPIDRVKYDLRRYTELKKEWTNLC